MSAAQPDLVFAALADPTRRAIVEQLSDGQARRMSDIGADLPITRQAIAKHLAIIEDAGLIVREKYGREIRITLKPQPLESATSWLEDRAQQWDDRLSALSRHLS